MKQYKGMILLKIPLFLRSRPPGIEVRSVSEYSADQEGTLRET